jgi:uncharacterized membrane protein YraQ (UPF0718 family)
MEIIYEIFAASWSFYLEASVYMLFGFLAAGVLHVLFKPETISKYLGRGKYRSVVLSALAGIPIPLCSCGVIPAASGLKRSGANSGATLSFLIATPETGIDSIPITYALIDPIMTVIRPIAALVTAVTAGFTENLWPKKQTNNNAVSNEPANLQPADAWGCDASCSPGSGPVSKAPNWKTRGQSGIRFAFEELLGDIGKWFLLGVLLAGGISILIPDQFIQSHIGQGPASMLLMIVIGIPMYVCATASTPIAAALILKGLSPGAALVFLLVGPATNIATMTMISGFLGKRSLAIYLGSIIICSLILGLITDAIYESFHIPIGVSAGRATELIPHGFEAAAAFVLGALMIRSLWKSRARKKALMPMGSPDGISCGK